MANVNTPRIGTINGTIRISGSINSVGDNLHGLGTQSNRFSDLFATQTTIGAFCESGLRTEGIGKNPDGTIVVWRNGTLLPCSEEGDSSVIGVVRHNKDEPIVLGAENILVTGNVEEGDFIITSDIVGHGKGVKRGMIFKKDLFGKVIAQALQSASGESSIIKSMIMKM